MHCVHNERCDVNLERSVVSLGPASQRMEEKNWVPVASAEDHIPGILWTQHTQDRERGGREREWERQWVCVCEFV